MKLLASALAIFMAVVLWAPRHAAADIEQFLSLYGAIGADRENGSSAGHGGSNGGRAGARGILLGLGVLPIAKNWGLQGILSYVGGAGSRFGATLGPIYGWDGGLPFVGGQGGKAGLFIAYQHRNQTEHAGNDFVWFRPSMALYYPQSNVNLWYSQGVSNSREGTRDPAGYHTREDHAGDQLQLSWSYFPAVDVGPFLRKDNWELTLGLQMNNMWTGGVPTGVGGVAGFAVMPMRNVVVNVIRLAADSESRFRAETGVQYVLFGKAGNLKELRRQYLEPSNGIDAPGTVAIHTGCNFGAC